LRKLCFKFLHFILFPWYFTYKFKYFAILSNDLLLLLLLDFGFGDFNEGCHFVVVVDVST
jgi:hypothetical protein